MELRLGTQIAGRYRLLEEIGTGSMGTVWRAQDLGLDCPCAVKVILPELASSEEMRMRLRREAKVAARIRCPNVVDIFEAGEWHGLPYIAMELLEGEDLYTRLVRRTRLLPRETYAIVVQVARALARAHALGIVHRDIKPENIVMVPGDEHEVVKVVDFGIAKHDSFGIADRKTKAGSLLGTPFYMSPEQARGETADWRSDLWSLAVVTFHCLTGRTPFDGDALGQIFAAILHEKMPVPSQFEPKLGEAVDRWWARAAARDRALRFQTAAAFADELASALGYPALPVPVLRSRGSSGGGLFESSPEVPRGPASTWVMASEADLPSPIPVPVPAPSFGSVPGSAAPVVRTRRSLTASSAHSRLPWWGILPGAASLIGLGILVTVRPAPGPHLAVEGPANAMAAPSVTATGSTAKRGEGTIGLAELPSSPDPLVEIARLPATATRAPADTARPGTSSSRAKGPVRPTKTGPKPASRRAHDWQERAEPQGGGVPDYGI